MRKSIIALAALLAAGIFVEAPAAEAQGLRVGTSWGGAYTPNMRPPIADSSILDNARRQQEKRARRQAVPAEPRQSKADRRRAAAAAAAERRQAEARARAEKAAAARPATPITRPAPGQDATPADLEAAQRAQRDKADELLRRLSKTTPAAPAAPPVAAPANPAKVVVAPAVENEPARTQVVKPTPTPAAAPKATPTGECRRFIPGAGITVSVPCSE